MPAALQRPLAHAHAPPSPQVVLEPLPPGVQRAISRHNSEALDLFAGYVQSYAAGLDSQAQAALPLSGARIPAAPAGMASRPSAAPAAPPAAAAPGSLLDLLARLRVRYAACSPFAALSGRGDNFSSMDDLVRSVRSGVLIDVATLPAVGMADRHGQVGCWAARRFTQEDHSWPGAGQDWSVERVMPTNAGLCQGSLPRAARAAQPLCARLLEARAEGRTGGSQRAA